MPIYTTTPGAAAPGSAEAIAAQRRREEEEAQRRAAEAQTNVLASNKGNLGAVATPPPGLQQVGTVNPALGTTNLGAVAAPPAGLNQPWQLRPEWGGPASTADPLRDLRDKFLAERAGVGGPAPTLDTTLSGQARGLALGQIGNLQQVASGAAPSVADAQRKAAMFDVNQTALGAAGASRGDAGASRTLFRSLGDQGRRAGVDAAMVKATEVSQANQLLGSLIGSTRTADAADATANLDAGLRSRGIDVEERMGLGKLGLEAQTTESETRLREAQISDLKAQLKLAYDRLRAETDAKKREFWGQMITSTIAALGGVGAAAATGKP